MRIKLVGWALAHRDDFLIDLRSHSRFRGDSVTVVLVVLLLIVLTFMFLLPRILNPPHRINGYFVKQIAQFHSIDAAIELFRADKGVYPPSDALDEDGRLYCGAMKLSEAMMGRDLMGFHPDSVFRSDGTDSKGNILYPKSDTVSGEAYTESLSSRKGPYLPFGNANALTLADLYGAGNTGSFDPNNYVLCDVFLHVKVQGKRRKVGMPVLYYKADTSKTAHDINDPNNPENIYNYKDNHDLLALGVPGKPGQKHPLYENPKIFYEMTKNDRVAGPSVPNRADMYILLSAGRDGLYGTKDDIANFQFRLKPK